MRQIAYREYMHRPQQCGSIYAELDPSSPKMKKENGVAPVAHAR